MEPQNEAGTSKQFLCNVCQVACSSALDLQMHVRGAKHELFENTLKAHGVVKSGSAEPGNGPDDAPDSAPVVSLTEELDAYRSTEPAIGLGYLLEYRMGGNYLWYECQLCDCDASLTNMFMHVVGSKHRQAYLQKHYPEMCDVSVRGSEATKKLKELAAEVEAREGRKKIQVVPYTQQLKRKFVFEDDAPEPKKIPPPLSPESLPPGSSFQELKKAHAEEAKREGLDKSVDGFGTKKDLIEYLRRFQINGEDDAAFILKVTQNFTQSLVRYREKVQENAQAPAAAPAVTYPPQEQANAPQSTGQNIYSHNNRNNMPGQQVPAPLGHNAYTEYPPRNMPGQRAPVSAGPPSSANQAGPPSFAIPPKPVVPAPANVMGLSSGLGPLVGTNKATMEFFNSIKNMDAKEVSATLNKIAASNPAFKGIDIPNLIKILQESGSLKTSKGSS